MDLPIPSRARVTPRGGAQTLSLLIVASVAIKLAILAATAESPLIYDERSYAWFADQILRGEGMTRSFRPPVYPYALAFAQWLAPEGTSWRVSAGLLQIALSAFTMFLMYGLGTELFGRRAGLAAAAIFGFYPNLVAHTTLLWSETVMLCPLVAALLFLVRVQQSLRPLQALGAGALLGLTALTREFALYFVPIAALWLALAGDSRRRGIRAGAFILLGAVLVIAPWTLRNARVLGAFVPIATNTWTPLYAGDHAPGGAFYGQFGERDVEREREARTRALESFREHPVRWAVARVNTAVPKLLTLDSFPLRNLRNGWYGEVGRRSQSLLTLLIAGCYVVLIGAIAWGLAATRWNAPRALPLLFALFACAVVLPFPTPARYRLPVLVAAIPFAAAWLASSEGTRRSLGSRGRVLLAGGAIAIAWLIAFQGWPAVAVTLTGRGKPEFLCRAVLDNAARWIDARVSDEDEARCVDACRAPDRCRDREAVKAIVMRELVCRARLAQLVRQEELDLDVEATVAECLERSLSRPSDPP